MTFVKTAESYRQGTHTLGRDYYTSPEIFAEERERIFATHWTCVGRTERVAEPGRYFLARIAGESIIVVHGRDGVLRAFYNVCRHRGTRICDADSGCFSETIQCPYHAWTYSLDGRLIGAPYMQDVEDFYRGDYPLHPAGLAEWEGLIFINPDAGALPFEREFAPLIGRFSRWGLPDLRLARRIEYDVAANWKLVFLNFSECLHCPLIHPLLNRRTPFTSGQNDLVDGPFLGGFMEIGTPDGTMSVSGHTCGLPVGELPPDDRGRAYYYSIFPNLLLSLFPDYALFHTLWPEGPTRTRIVCEWLFLPDTLSDPSWNPGDAIEFWDTTNREDWRIAERSQAGIGSRVYGPSPFSPRESLLAAWDREYLRRMGRLDAE